MLLNIPGGFFGFCICFFLFFTEIKGGHASFQNRDFSFAGKNSAQVGSRLAYPRPGGEGTEPNHLHGNSAGDMVLGNEPSRLLARLTSGMSPSFFSILEDFTHWENTRDRLTSWKNCVRICVMYVFLVAYGGLDVMAVRLGSSSCRHEGMGG